VDRLVWIDCEMTGLDLVNDRLIEVAVLITDGELNLVDDDGLDLVISAPDDVLDGMVPVVAKMHADSGLTDAVRASTLSVADAEQQVLEYIRAHVPERRKAPLCGNSIATDRGFLARDMKELDDWLHYRMVDVSSVKELARRWYPRAYYASPEKKGGHRALADILESVEELRYYRQAIFVPQPGPTTDEAKAISAAMRDEPTVPPETPSGNSDADTSAAG
jgi:oligoribonuclease